MDGQRPAALEINQLHLRLPGLDAETGHRVAASTAKRLADELPSGRQLRLPQLQLRLAAGADTSPESLTEAIVRGVIGALADPGQQQASSPNRRR